MKFDLNRKIVRRLAVPLAVFLLVSGFAVGAAVYLEDEAVGSREELTRLRSETDRLIGEVTRLKRSQIYVADNSARYTLLLERRVVGFPDRIAALEKIGELQRRHDVEAGIRYRDEVRYELRPVGDARAELVQTTIEMSIEAGTDREVLGFIDSLVAALPGFVSIRGLRIDRTMETLDIVGEILRTPDGEPRNMPRSTRAQLTLDWTRILFLEQPRDDASKAAGDGAPPPETGG